MNDSTPSDNKPTKTNDNSSTKADYLKTKLIRPSKDTVFFLQMFARAYKPTSLAAAY